MFHCKGGLQRLHGSASRRRRRRTAIQGIPASEVAVLGFKALGADHGSDEGPHVEEQTHPTGRHLDPEHGPASIQQLLNLVIVVAAAERKGRKAHREAEGRTNRCLISDAQEAEALARFLESTQ